MDGSGFPDGSRASAEPVVRHSWLGVWAIAIGAFALVVIELLPVGLLTGISRDLGVSEGTAGLAVTATAILGFLAAPVTAIAIGRADRRWVLIALTGLLVVSSILSSFANSFPMLLIGRVVLGVGVGGFWAISITAAAKLVPEDKVHAASSLVFAGISLASVVSVPIAAYIGAHYDWRLAFMGAGVLGVVVLALQLAFLPRIAITHGVSAGQFFGLLKSPKAVAIFVTVVLVVSGQYAGYTFITPYLERISHVGLNLISLLMLVYGVVAVIGNFVGGALAAKHLHRTVLLTVAIYILALAGLAILPGSALVSIASLVVWALAWGMAPVATQLWLFHDTRDAPEAAQAMNTCLFQFSIGFGSLLGGLAVNGTGLHSAMWLGVAILCAAMVVVLIADRIDAKPAA